VATVGGAAVLAPGRETQEAERGIETGDLTTANTTTTADTAETTSMGGPRTSGTLTGTGTDRQEIERTGITKTRFVKKMEETIIEEVEEEEEGVTTILLLLVIGQSR